MAEIKYNSQNTDWGLMDSLIITDETIQQKSCPINHNGFNYSEALMTFLVTAIGTPPDPIFIIFRK